MDIQKSNFLKRAEENVVLILKTISRYNEFHILKSGDLLFRSIPIKNVNQELQ